MKLLILLAFTISSSFAAINIPLSKFELDLNNFETLNFGVAKMLEAGQKAGKIVTNPFDITRIYTISYDQSETRDYYNFEVQLDDSQGSIIQATLRVRVEGGQAISLVSFNYKVTKTTIRTTLTATNSTVPTSQTTETNPVSSSNQPVATNNNVPQTSSPVTNPSTPSTQTTVPNPSVPQKPGTGGNSNVPQAQGLIGSLDPDIQAALNFGAKYVLQKGYSQNKIANGQDYQVTQINNVNKNSQNSQVTYKFDIEMENSNEKITINMTFTVIKNSAGDFSVPTYNYHVTTTTTGLDDIGPKVTIPSSQYNDPDIQQALNFGTNNVLQSGYKSGKIPNGEDYTVSTINSVIKETGKNAVRYKFDVEMANRGGNIDIQMQFTVQESSSGQLSVVAFNYAIQTTTTTTT